ncbi:retrovirus-related pol polyprotein from transposon TNT 1-94 [Tanacetum coccineum]
MGQSLKTGLCLSSVGKRVLKQEFSNARTPQQNGVAERMNRTLIEAARTMLADSHLPTTFWHGKEAVNTACYTFNRHLGPVPATAPTSTNPVNTSSDYLTTGFEEVTSGNIEAISPSDDHEEEVFSDADDDEMLNKGFIDIIQVKREVYVSQPPGFVDPDHPKKVYKVVKALYGLHQAPRAWYATLSTFLEKHGYRRVTPMETKALWLKMKGPDVDLHLYRSMIGCLMYLTASRPDIMYAVCACSRFQENLHSQLVAYSDSDYAAANLDRKSTMVCFANFLEGAVLWSSAMAANQFWTMVSTSMNTINIHIDNQYYWVGKDVAGQLGTWKRTASCHLLNGCKLVLGFLFKSAESAGYTEIVDFLRRSKLRYALTHNPPVYDSLVKQFWQTATARTLADGDSTTQMQDRFY